jgi:protein-disulfide isomerase
MSKRHGWFIVLLIATMLVAACGPEMATPTPADEVVAESSSPTAAAVGETPESKPTSAGEEPEPAGEWPVDPDNWHVLGSPDAPVTIIEYSDFQ